MHHYDDLGTARFITFNCHKRLKLLTDEKRIRMLLEEIDHARKKYGFSLLGFVVMPNHVHLVLYPNKDVQAGRVIGEIKSLTARRIGMLSKSQKRHNRAMFEVIRNKKYRYVFWQRRCYDHNCRTPQTVIEKINYCHMNPVKARLVRNPSEWPWSSYRWYMGYDDAVLEVDGVDLLT